MTTEQRDDGWRDVRATRRTVLGVSAATLAGLAGCNQSGDGGSGTTAAGMTDGTGSTTAATTESADSTAETTDDADSTTAEGASTDAGTWNQWLGGAARTGVGSGDALTGAPSESWTYEFEVGSPSVVTVADGTAYAVSRHSEYDSESGAVRRRIDVAAVDLATGDERWLETVIDEDGQLSQLPTSAPTVADGRVYVVLSRQFEFPDGALVALDAETGGVEWRRFRFAGHFGGPLAAGGRVFTLGVRDQTALRCLNPDGSEVWANSLDGDATGIQFLSASDGTLVVGSDSRFRGLDAGSGDSIWSIGESLDHFVGRPPVIRDGALYLAEGSNLGHRPSDAPYTLRSFSLSGGAENWRTPLTDSDGGEAKARGPIAVTDDAVFVTQTAGAGTDAELVAYATADGAELWRASLDGASFDGVQSPTVVDDTAYLCDGNRLAAVTSAGVEWTADVAADGGLRAWGVPVTDGTVVVTNQAASSVVGYE